MPSTASISSATARSPRDGIAKGPMCAVRPISTISAHRERKDAELRLRHVAEHAREARARPAGDRLAVDSDAALPRGEQAQDAS